MKKYDVIVVGGGPVGSSAARFCSESGLKTLMIEEHASFGRPVQCAGLLSNNAFSECHVSKHSVLNEVSGAKVVSGLGNTLSFDAKKTMSYVVDRSLLDFEMAKNAVDAGADPLLKTSVVGYLPEGNSPDTCTVQTSGINGDESFESRIVIAADGPRSIFTRFLNMPRASIYLSGIQTEVPINCVNNLVEVHPYSSPDFFGWIIPMGNNICRVGLCGERDVNSRFTEFLKRIYSSGNFKNNNLEPEDMQGGLQDISSLHLVSGTVPIGVMPQTYGKRVLFCGDAGGFAKPTSGGGIYTGIRTARHAAETALKCCESQRFNDSDLKMYERLWRSDLGKELKLGMMLYNIRKKVSNEQIDKLCVCLNTPKIQDEIVKYGDMDRPQEIVRKLIFKPCIVKNLGGLISSEIMSIIH